MAGHGHSGGRRINVLAVIGLTAIYLLFADWIVVRMAKNQGESIVQKARSVPPFPAARYSIDKVQTSLGSLLEKVEVIGWVLPPEESNAFEEGPIGIELVFQTGNTWYRVPTEPRPRPDVLSAFEIGDSRCTPGFSSVFSPVPMKGGVYRMGVEVQDHGRTIAFAWTGNRFIHDRKGFRELLYHPVLTPMDRPEPNGEMQAHAFDLFTRTATTVEMSGWAFANTGGASGDQDVLLVFSDEENTVALTTDKRPRPDLRDVFGDRMGVIGESAGYFARLDAVELPLGTYQLGLLIRENGSDIAFQWMPNRIVHSPSKGAETVFAPP